MFVMAGKLKNVEKKIKRWNREVFGNIFRQKERLRQELNAIEEEISRSGTDQRLYNKEKEVKLELHRVVVREERFWRQKSIESMADGRE